MSTGILYHLLIMSKQKEWKPLLFRARMRARGLSSAEVAARMGRDGYQVGAATIRRWTAAGSLGPRHTICSEMLMRLVDREQAR